MDVCLGAYGEGQGTGAVFSISEWSLSSLYIGVVSEGREQQALVRVLIRSVAGEGRTGTDSSSGCTERCR